MLPERREEGPAPAHQPEAITFIEEFWRRRDPIRRSQATPRPHLQRAGGGGRPALTGRGGARQHDRPGAGPGPSSVPRPGWPTGRSRCPPGTPAARGPTRRSRPASSRSETWTYREADLPPAWSSCSRMKDGRRRSSSSSSSEIEPHHTTLVEGGKLLDWPPGPPCTASARQPYSLTCPPRRRCMLPGHFEDALPDRAEDRQDGEFGHVLGSISSKSGSPASSARGTGDSDGGPARGRRP